MNTTLKLIGSKIKYSADQISSQHMNLTMLKFDMLQKEQFSTDKNADINDNIEKALDKIMEGLVELRKAINKCEE